MDDHGQAPCIHLSVDEDQQGDCLQGRSFPAGCRVMPSGHVACACYVPSTQLADWEALRIVQRWRTMRQHYVSRRAEFDRHE